MVALLAVFGVPPLPLHGPLHQFGVMSPTCGMTRAARALAGADVGLAWRYNPASFAVAAVGAALLARAVVGAWRGRWRTPTVRVGRRGWIAIGAVTAMLWINQQAHVDLLR